MHPLLDRRDLTRQRNGAGAPAAPIVHVDLDELAGELVTTNRLLRALLAQETGEIQQLCVSDREPPAQRMANFPLAGVERFIIRRAGAGGTFTLAAGTPALVLEANENRLGGRIVAAATASAGVSLYLSTDLLTPGAATPLAGGAATILLNPGAAWDMKLGDVLWCGHIIAVGPAGAVVTVAEV